MLSYPQEGIWLGGFRAIASASRCDNGRVVARAPRMPRNPGDGSASGILHALGEKLSSHRYRLYVDEVGTDDITHVTDDNNRYLSLTGIAMTLKVARDELDQKFSWIKKTVFDHDPDEPLIFHRSDIVKRKRAFGTLLNKEKGDLFDRAIFRAMEGTDYCVITVMVDKLGMVRQPNWKNQHPYHYLMEILIEKYVQLLERKGAEGDVMPEARQGKKDVHLQLEFERVLSSGTHFVGSPRMTRIVSKRLKFRPKSANIAGLQLADLIAHPGHMYLRSLRGHDVTLGPYATRVCELLVGSKFDRSTSGTISGYGTKWFP